MDEIRQKRDDHEKRLRREFEIRAELESQLQFGAKIKVYPSRRARGAGTW
jgi:hypothetical protein